MILIERRKQKTRKEKNVWKKSKKEKIHLILNVYIICSNNCIRWNCIYILLKITVHNKTLRRHSISIQIDR